jgi:hypothetical protein
MEVSREVESAEEELVVMVVKEKGYEAKVAEVRVEAISVEEDKVGVRLAGHG